MLYWHSNLPCRKKFVLSAGPIAGMGSIFFSTLPKFGSHDTVLLLKSMVLHSHKKKACTEINGSSGRTQIDHRAIGKKKKQEIVFLKYGWLADHCFSPFPPF